jgi:hypothetical protein
MTTDSNTTGPASQNSPSFGIGSFLFAVLLAFIIFLLVATMVRHRFFRGGHPHRPAASLTSTPVSIGS